MSTPKEGATSPQRRPPPPTSSPSHVSSVGGNARRFVHPLLSASIIDLLEADSRPSLVVTPNSGLPGHTPSVIFCNPALKAAPDLRDIVATAAEHAPLWAGLDVSLQQAATASPAPVSYRCRFWTRMILGGGTLAVISADQCETSTAPEAARLSTMSPGTESPPAIPPPLPLPPPDPFQRHFSEITDFMPVGMCILEPAGSVMYANQAWYHSIGCPPPLSILEPNYDEEPAVVMTHEQFLSYIVEEDQAAVRGFHLRAAALPPPDGCGDDTGSLSFGFRVKISPSRPPLNAVSATATTGSVTGSLRGSRTTAETSASFSPQPLLRPENSHLLATAFPHRDAEGHVTQILVCVQDVTDRQAIAEAAERHAQQANNLRRMAECATVGMYDMDLDGRLRGANRVFYEMCGLMSGDVLPDLSHQIVKPWLLACVEDQDRPLVEELLERTAQRNSGDDDSTVHTAEIRFKKPWRVDNGTGDVIQGPRWIEVTFLPVTDAKGRVESVMGSLSDVSVRRWQLERELQLKEEAIESRWRQENFVDITAHEIRNPLTAIMHCADAVLECLAKLRTAIEVAEAAANTRAAAAAMASLDVQGGLLAPAPAVVSPAFRSLLHDSIDYAEIIVSSALHQKAIVDDILTMSKLDSKLLAVTPVVCDPLEIVRVTLKMFEVQARQQNIVLRMEVDNSYQAIVGGATATAGGPATSFLCFDPSRVKQILINLLTNALKFTRAAVDIREVTTTVKASYTRPTDELCHVAFVPRLEPKKTNHRPAAASKNTVPRTALPDNSTATTDASVFLLFEVRDTGEGLRPEGMDSLFQKFVQADSRTHVKHGGSGLGLFISKRLAEIQNGAIGVASTPGIGSTFAFYIKAAVSPPNTVPDMLSPGEAAKVASAIRLGDSSSTASISSRMSAGATNTTAATDTAETPRPQQAMDAYFPTPSPRMATVNVPTDLNTGSPSPRSEAATTDTADTSDTVATTTTATTDPMASLGTSSSSTSMTGMGVLPAQRFTEGGGGGGGGTATTFVATTLSSAQLALSPTMMPGIEGVLLVEDNPVNQKVTRRYLEQCGFRVQVAANGLEAMERLRQSDRCVHGSYPVSVVLMDMEMPVQDGLTCTRHIRELEASGVFAGGRVPVLMITGNARPEQLEEAWAAGSDDVIVKPFQMQTLFEHINVVMRALWEAEGTAEKTTGSDASTAASRPVRDGEALRGKP